MDSPLLTKSKQFALEIIKVCNIVKSTKKDTVLTNQLLRSGTSVGANIREAFYGHSRADFIAKLQISLKECSESEYWIELLLLSQQAVTLLNSKKEQLIFLFAFIIKSDLLRVKQEV